MGKILERMDFISVPLKTMPALYRDMKKYSKAALRFLMFIFVLNCVMVLILSCVIS